MILGKNVLQVELNHPKDQISYLDPVNEAVEHYDKYDIYKLLGEIMIDSALSAAAMASRIYEML